MITNVAIEKLHPHFRNPRKNLGDLAELAESIKAQGVLQNLTVVMDSDGRCTTCAHCNGADGSCEKDFQDELIKLIHLPENENIHISCPEWQWKERYTVVIGHRRLAAAKLAGLTELPCTVSDMDQRTQIATMLLENIQRNDLTVYEQAQGFQMMLDLGDTVNAISERTGFSTSTVRRRISLLELDQDKFKKSEARGATLMEYAELEKIEDLGRKNDVLDKIGTDNFKYALKQALDAEKLEKRIAAYREALSAFATEIDNSSGYRHIKSYSYYRDDKIERPEDADTVEYFFNLSKYGSAYLYAKGAEPERVEDPEIKRRREKKEWRSTQLKEATERAFALRKEFIQGMSNTAAKKHIAELIGFAVIAIDDSYFNGHLFAELLGIEEDSEGEITSDIITSGAQKAPERALLYMAYCSAGDGESEGYYGKWNLEYHENSALDDIYALLEKLGYGMSDEEKELQNGSHTLFSDDEVEQKPEDPCALCKSAHPHCDNCCAVCEDKCNGAQMCRKQTENTEDETEGDE